MKKIIVALLMVLFFLSFNSCDNEDEEDTEKITDALKISTWVLDKNLEGTGYFAYDETYPDYGYWVSNESDKQYDNDEVFKYEQLKLNEARVMAPMGYKYKPNLNIHLEFDGIVEVETEIPNDDRIQLAYSLESPDDPQLNNWTAENGFRVLAPITINVCPIGKFNQTGAVIIRETLTDREYYLNVRTYNLEGTQIITAKLKLTVLEDKEYPYEDVYFPIFSPNEVRSRFLSIELILYEYNDLYKLGIKMGNDKLLKKYKDLSLNLFHIGLRKETKDSMQPYFCTPIGADIFASLGVEGIHYCTIDGFGDTIFVVSPEPGIDDRVFPVAENFGDFVRLILALHGTSYIDQIPLYTKERFYESLNKAIDSESIERKNELSELKKYFDVEPMDSPYEYVMEISSAFDRSKIEFSDEYYRTAGIERE